VPDCILIEQLELSAHIGVPDAERASPQRLTVNLEIEPHRAFDPERDEIGSTIDYFNVACSVQEFAAARPRQLIETLAVDIAEFILSRYGPRAVQVELRKYILPDTAFVAVRVRRESSLDS